MKKWIAVLLATMLFLAACGADESASGEDGKFDYEINMGYYNCDHMMAGPVGEARGFYEKHGLNVSLTGNGKVPEAMAAAKMDAGLVGFSRIIGAVGQGSPVVITTMNHTGGSEYLVGAPDINSPEDLIGQPVAIPLERNIDLLEMNSFGLSLDPNDYELVNVDSDADKYLALTQGQIKAYTCCDPWGSMAEYNGTGKILDTYNDSEHGICCGFTMSRDFINNHEEEAIALLNAYVESTKFIYEHPIEAARVFAEYYHVPAEVGLMTVYQKCVNEGRTLSWKHEPERIQHTYDIYAKHDFIEKLPEVEELFEVDLYEKADLDDFDAFIANEVDPIFPRDMSYEEFRAKAVEIDGELESE